MTKKQRAAYVLRRLEELYPVVPVPLDHKDPFTLLVAVLLSAQCTDERVNRITPALFELADNPHEMQEKAVEEVESIIRPCGLGPRKAKAIVELSHLLVRNHDGQVPKELSLLEQLPGVGHKTASVVVSQAFGQPAFAVDTHIHRLAQRWGLTCGKNVKKTEQDLKALFPRSSWSKLHLQIIFYGREHCQARACYGVMCEICKSLYPLREKAVVVKKP